MLFNPLRYLAKLIVKTLFNRLGINNGIYLLSANIISTSLILFRTVGLFPTLRVLYYLGSAIRRNIPLEVFRNLYFDRLNPVVFNTLINAIKPYYHIVGNYVGYSFIYHWFIFPLVASACLKPLVIYTFRFSIGALLSSMGIIWNETLAALPYLKDSALFIIDFFESFIHISIPKVNQPIESVESNLPVESTQPIESLNLDELKDTSNFLSFIGLILLSFVGLIFIVGLTDYYHPEFVKDTPVINTIADNNHSVLDYIKSWFPGGSTPPATPSVDAPEVMSRQSSGGTTGSLTPRAFG